MNDDLQFIAAESAGAPLLLCPAEITGYWEGVNNPSGERRLDTELHLNDPDGVHVDYDGACDAATDYVNTIQIGSGQALLLGEEIPAMYWVAATNFVGGYLVTWVYLAEGELPNLRELLAARPAATFNATA